MNRAPAILLAAALLEACTNPEHNCPAASQTTPANSETEPGRAQWIAQVSGEYFAQQWINDLASQNDLRFGFAFGLFRSTLFGLMGGKKVCFVENPNWETLMLESMEFINEHGPNMSARGIRNAEEAIAVALVVEHGCKEAQPNTTPQNPSP